ncbi:hypothetical protein NDU88_001863 [Pleurodeles waltl]|uniref:Prolactin receptor n=1 Tax=Pleurodeles waltl TaxID=8319 RepID=A0AAV7PA02_PLEWA|nr:hypothetical protein NDU88_001863 [Pleurodeles waltl]
MTNTHARNEKRVKSEAVQLVLGHEKLKYTRSNGACYDSAMALHTAGSQENRTQPTSSAMQPLSHVQLERLQWKNADQLSAQATQPGTPRPEKGTVNLCLVEPCPGNSRHKLLLEDGTIMLWPGENMHADIPQVPENSQHQ